MVTYSSVLAWKIPGTAEPSGLRSLGLHRVGHDWSDLASAATRCFRSHHKNWLQWGLCFLHNWKPFSKVCLVLWKGVSLRTQAPVGSSHVCNGTDVLGGPEFGHPWLDSKDKAKQLSATALEPGLSCMSSSLSLWLISWSKKVSLWDIAVHCIGWLEAFWSWASAEPIREGWEQVYGDKTIQFNKIWISNIHEPLG